MRRREPAAPGGIVGRHDAGCRSRHACDGPGHRVHEPRALDKPPRRQMRHPAHGGHGGRHEQIAAAMSAIPPAWTTVISGIAAKFSSSPAAVTREKTSALTGKQRQFGRQRRGEKAGRHPEGQRRRAHASQQERRAGEDGDRRAIGQPGAGVAHRERVQGEASAPADAPMALYGSSPVIDGVGHQVQHGHLRGAHHRGAAAHQARIADERDRHRDVRHAAPASRPARRRPSAPRRGSRCCRPRSRSRDTCRPPAAAPRSPRPGPRDRRSGSHVTMAADRALCTPTDWSTRPPDPRPQLCSGLGVDPRPRATTCTSIALFTPPTSVVPRRASAASSSPRAGIEVARRAAELRGQPDQPAPPPLLDATQGASPATVSSTPPAARRSLPSMHGVAARRGRAARRSRSATRRASRRPIEHRRDRPARPKRRAARPPRRAAHRSGDADGAMRRRRRQCVPARRQRRTAPPATNAGADPLPPRQEAQRRHRGHDGRGHRRAGAARNDARARLRQTRATAGGDGRVAHAASCRNVRASGPPSRRGALCHGAEGGCRERADGGIAEMCDVRSAGGVGSFCVVVLQRPHRQLALAERADRR